MSETTSVQNGSLEFFTIVARNYLAYAFVLGKSVLEHHPDANFSIFLMDDVDREWKRAIEGKGFRAIYPEEIPLADYRKFVFQYNITEASTGVKPSVIQMLFARGAEKVIYLDPDILCFRRFDEVLAALDQCNIVLTPHICSPAPDEYFPGERGLLKSGVFNLGFIGLRAKSESLRFLSWWAAHLERECIQESDAGLFVDQKWADLAPVCFDGVYILRSPAYNIAYWNLHERLIEDRRGKPYEARSGERVAFIHFSGLTSKDCVGGICKYVPRNPFDGPEGRRGYTLAERPDLVGPFNQYRDLLSAAGAEGFSKLEYAFARYGNGEPIAQLERSLYLASDVWRDGDLDPFSAGPASFWNACRNAGIRAISSASAGSSAPEIVRSYGRYMRFIELVLRYCVRILGPSRYLEFAKYMRHQFLPLNHGFLLSRRRLEKISVGSGEELSLEASGPRA